MRSTASLRGSGRRYDNKSATAQAKHRKHMKPMLRSEWRGKACVMRAQPCSLTRLTTTGAPFRRTRYSTIHGAQSDPPPPFSVTYPIFFGMGIVLLRAASICATSHLVHARAAGRAFILVCMSRPRAIPESNYVHPTVSKKHYVWAALLKL